MGIVTTQALYQRCLDKPWAVGGFIGYNMEIMQAAVDAARDEKAPILIQASCRVVDYAGAGQLYAMASALSQDFGVDIALHLDHGDTVERCKHCIDHGFSSVMLDCTDDCFEENVSKTREVVNYAHSHGAVVEGEVFHPIDGKEKYSTGLEEAIEYVALTQCDSLSVCCGNAHGINPDYPKKLHLDQLAALHQALPNMPFVLHATSVFSKEFIDRANRVGACRPYPINFDLKDLQQSYSLGVCKVNSALDIKILFTTAVREYMLANPREMDPRKYLGFARDELRAHIAEKHRLVFLDSQKA